jgi:hypothetical protein
MAQNPRMHARGAKMGLFTRKGKKRWYRREWLSLSDLYSEQMQELMKHEANKAIFDEEYFDAVHERRAETRSQMQKIAIINTLLLGALFINAAVTTTDMQIFGFKISNVAKLKEVLLFASAVLTLAWTQLRTNEYLLGAALRAGVDGRYNEDVRPYVGLRYGWSPHHPRILNRAPHRMPPMFILTWWDASKLLYYIMAVAIVPALYGMIAFVIIDVVWNPSLPPVWAYIAALVAIAANLYSLLSMFYGPIPFAFQDYRPAIEFDEFQKNNGDPRAIHERFQKLKKELGHRAGTDP